MITRDELLENAGEARGLVEWLTSDMRDAMKMANILTEGKYEEYIDGMNAGVVLVAHIVKHQRQLSSFDALTCIVAAIETFEEHRDE